MTRRKTTAPVSGQDPDTLALKIESLEAKISALDDLRRRLEQQGKTSAGMAEELFLAHRSAADAERRASDTASTFIAILDAMSEGVAMVDPSGHIEMLNAAAESMLARRVASVTGRHISDYISVENGYNFSAEALDTEQLSDVEGIVRAGPRSEIQVEVSARKVAGNSKAKFIVVFKNINERKAAEATIRNLAMYDSLTDLANRNLFHQRLDDGIKLCRRNGKKLALLYLDLDDFKSVNDTCGHPIGDGLLRTVAARVKSATREIDTVARLGGDEFAVIMPELTEISGACQLARRIIDAVSKPMTVDGTLVQTGTSIGISVFPDSAMDTDELVRLADIALYEAKNAGRSCFKLHDEQSLIGAAKRSNLETDLKLAIVRGELEVHYQPIVDAENAAPVAAEALVRWRHPSRGLISPDEFIPLAEELGLIRAIGQQVMTAACHACRRWVQEGWPSIRVAVNVSPLQFARNSLIEDVAASLRASKLAARHLELEVNEGLYIKDYEHVIPTLMALRALGVQCAIDDFGTGYSSLSRLHRIPAHRLKIDRSFVRDLPDDPDSAVIVQTIALLARSLGMDIVAEGVETEEQSRFLREQGCDELQGYLFSKPCPENEFLEWLAANRGPGKSNRTGRKPRRATASRSTRKRPARSKGNRRLQDAVKP